MPLKKTKTVKKKPPPLAKPAKKTAVDLPKDARDYFLLDPKRTVVDVYDAYKHLGRGYSLRHLYGRSRKEKWTKQRQDIAKKIDEKKVEAIVETQTAFVVKTLAEINKGQADTIAEMRRLNREYINKHTVDGVFQGDTQELRRLLQNEKDLAEWERLVFNYPMRDPVKGASGEDVQGALSQDDLALLEAFKNG